MIYKFEKEDHTLGNLLQGELLNDPDVVFAGYSVPHPLENIMVLEIDTNEDKTPQEALKLAREQLIMKLDKISELFNKILI